MIGGSFQSACWHKDLEAAKRALPLDKVNGGAEVPLFIACRTHFIPAIRWLLYETDANAVYTDWVHSNTCLHVAAQVADSRVMRALLEFAPCRALMERRTATGFTPLDVAVFNGHVATARLLLQFGSKDRTCVTEVPWFRDMMYGRRRCGMAVGIWMARWRTILEPSGNGYDVAVLVAKHIGATQWYKEWQH